MRLAISLLIAMLSAGCASGLRVTYYSDPPGATIYQGAQAMGQAPVTLTYRIEDSFKAGGCQRVQGTNAKWASGATAAIAYLDACSVIGDGQQYVFNRPDMAGREIDMNYALQLERNGILRQQAQAADTAATIQLMNALNPPRPAPAFPMPIHCQSYRVGNQVNTNCN